MSSPNPVAMSMVRIAVVGGAALTTLVLLWVFEVVSFEAFVGGMVLVALLETLAILRVVRRVQSGASSAPGTPPAVPGRPPAASPSAPPGTSAQPGTTAQPGAAGPRDVDTTGGHRNVGYDPMDGLPGVGDGR